VPYDLVQLNKDGAKLTKDTHDTMTSLKRVRHPISRECRCSCAHTRSTQAKENYYKMHKAADDAEAAYQKKKGEPAAKQKDVDKVRRRRRHSTRAVA
jgi:hypothetical protein